MGRYHAASAQRVDLLDDKLCQAGNKGETHRRHARQDAKGRTAAMLLDRLHAPQGQGNQSFGTVGT